MPNFQRRTLRQTLGIEYLRDVHVGTYNTNIQQNQYVGSLFVLDFPFIDGSASGQGLYTNAWIRIGGGASAYDYRVATYNGASGRFDSLMAARATFGVFQEAFEIHELTSPTEKDRAIDDAVRRVRVRREVGISSIDGLLFYTLDGAASPNTITDILDAYFFSNPGGSLDLQKRTFDWVKVVNTATGNVLRIAPALSYSQQLVLDAVLELTLGAQDNSVVNLPDDRWVLSGAAAKSWDIVAARAPSQELQLIRERRAEAAAQFTKLSLRFQPQIDRRLRFDDPGL